MVRTPPSGPASSAGLGRATGVVLSAEQADLVRSQSFEIIGEDKNVIVLRDASGFDVLLTVTCEEITEARTAAIDAIRLAREEADDEPPGEIIDLHSR